MREDAQIELGPLKATQKVKFTMLPVIGNLDSDLQRFVTIDALINPSSFKESWAPQWNKRGPLGGSHETLQYIRTTSRTLGFSLWVSQHIYVAENIPMLDSDRGVLFYRDWFAACSVPFGPRQSPPVIEVDWPEAGLSFKGVIDTISIDYERFEPGGRPLDMTIELAFVEVLQYGMMTTQEVLRKGMGYGALISD